MNKLYCFADETGQDTEGKLFLVAIVLKDIETLALLEQRLETIEYKSGKKQLKWKKINRKTKRRYLDELVKLKELRHAIFYSIYENTKEYSKLTSLTIAKAILARGQKDYTVTIIIDGLNDKERDVVRTELKKLKIKYRKIRGMREEQNIFLRLSDAMAGFLREVHQKEEYAMQFMRRLKKTNIVTEA